MAEQNGNVKWSHMLSIMSITLMLLGMLGGWVYSSFACNSGEHTAIIKDIVQLKVDSTTRLTRIETKLDELIKNSK